jgi:hypothetical protein
MQEFYKESGKSKIRPLFLLKRHSFFVAEVIESVWTDTGPCCDVDMTPTRTLLFRKSLFLSFGSWRTKPPLRLVHFFAEIEKLTKVLINNEISEVLTGASVPAGGQGLSGPAQKIGPAGAATAPAATTQFCRCAASGATTAVSAGGCSSAVATTHCHCS